MTSGTDICMRKASSYWLIRVWVSGSFHFVEFDFIQLAQGIEAAAPHIAVHAFRITHEQNRLTLRPTLYTLVDRRQEPAAPQALAAAGIGAATDQHDKPGQILIVRSQTRR